MNLEEISPILKDKNNFTSIEKGFSFDEKYVVDGNYLLRIFPSNEMDRRKMEFDCLHDLSQYSEYVPSPIEIGKINEQQSYMIVTYLAGEDGEVALAKLTEEEQYNAGEVAGRELKKLHQLKAPTNLSSWYEMKSRKSDRYLELLQEVPVDEKIISILMKYIKEKEHLMKDRPSTFQHDDFHPANLIIQNKTFAGIIDFQRMDWGDPLHDLCKLGFFSKRISVPFTRGVIDGYVGLGGTSPQFWELYSLYSAMHVASAIVWGEKVSGVDSDFLLKCSLQVIEDHEGFTKTIPKWYIENKEGTK